MVELTATSQTLPHQSIERRGRFSGWVVVSLAFSLVAIISVYTLDAPIAHWVHDHRIDALTKFWIRLRKLKFDWPGHFLCTLVIAALIALFHVRPLFKAGPPINLLG